MEVALLPSVLVKLEVDNENNWNGRRSKGLSRMCLLDMEASQLYDMNDDFIRDCNEVTSFWIPPFLNPKRRRINYAASPFRGKTTSLVSSSRSLSACIAERKKTETRSWNPWRFIGEGKALPLRLHRHAPISELLTTIASTGHSL